MSHWHEHIFNTQKVDITKNMCCKLNVLLLIYSICEAINKELNVKKNIKTCKILVSRVTFITSAM
jgi:hypothetical protein